MLVDSFKYLPRSFRGLYENPNVHETHEVWAPFGKRLTESRIALLSSAGFYVNDTQEPFDGDRERADPFWGDPTHREIPDGVQQGDLGMMHLHVNNDDLLADHDIALPTHRLRELVEDGVVGWSAPTHYSVMGYQGGLDAWRNQTAPAIVDRLRRDEADGLVLAPV